jgi:hypothetical protein
MNGNTETNDVLIKPADRKHSTPTALDRLEAVIVQGDAPIPPSRLPKGLRFPLVLVLSMAISGLLYSFAADYVASDLGKVSRRLDQWWEVGAVVAWRTAELAIGWAAGYDSYDLAALTILTHAPFSLLLFLFYEIPLPTTALALAIDTVAIALPFRLLRGVAAPHKVSDSAFGATFHPSSSRTVPNEDIVTDSSVQSLTGLLGASIYALTLHASFASYLPLTLVKYFENVETLAPARELNLATLLPFTAIIGIAARSFVFTPSVAARIPPSELAKKHFDPVTATFWQTIKYNLGMYGWGLSPRTKAVLGRTLVLVLLTAGNVAESTWGTLEGTDPWGAVMYALPWVGAAIFNGIAMEVVGNV